jgi:hypothetical protein
MHEPLPCSTRLGFIIFMGWFRVVVGNYNSRVNYPSRGGDHTQDWIPIPTHMQASINRWSTWELKRLRPAGMT